MSSDQGRVAVLIVGYDNVDDVRACLTSLGQAAAEPALDVFVCENAGAAAFERLWAGLSAPGSGCRAPGQQADAASDKLPERIVEARRLELAERDASVWILRAIHNLGYAGALNALISALPARGEWRGVWVLNPDTRVDPRALAELVERAEGAGKGMVGSTIVSQAQPDTVYCRGGLDQKLGSGRGICLHWGDKLKAEVNVESIEAAMRSVTGASAYVTWDALVTVGPMDERFFLYMEDLDWGERARRLGVNLGYAVNSLVYHEGGSTIGRSSANGGGRSWLSIYLMSRNRIAWVRKFYPGLFLYTAAISVLHALRYLVAGSMRDMTTALQGVVAGLRGEIGPPQRLVREGKAVARPPNPTTRRRLLKVGISAAYFLVASIGNGAMALAGRARKPRLTILYYHAVHADFVFEFHRQMETVSRFCQVVEANHEGPLPAGRKAVAITFDDALTSVMKNALPVLQRHGYPCVIFAPSGLLGRAPNWESDDPSYNFEDEIMSAEQLRELPRELVTVGSHTMHHANLAMASADVAEREIAVSRRQLMEVVNYDVDLFSAPYGGLDSQVIAQCRSAGYRFIYGILPDESDTGDAQFLRGRVRVDPWDGPFEFYLKTQGAYVWFAKLQAIKRRLRG